MVNTLPLPNPSAAHVDPKGKPTKDFYNYLKSIADYASRRFMSFTAFDAGTFSSGTYTPDVKNGNYQFLTNNGAFAWGVPVLDSALDVLVTNGASAGTITFNGSYKVATGNTGDPLDTTNGHQFLVSIRKINGVATYLIKALQ